MDVASYWQPAVDLGGRLGISCQIWLERARGMQALRAAREARFQALVRHARRSSPLFGALYRNVPGDGMRLEHLPVTTKSQLMARFDEWVTDPAVTAAGVTAFLADKDRVGDRFAERYVVWKSSGTSGLEGIFVQDEHALAVYEGLVALQLTSPDAAARTLAGSVTHAGRAALIAATGDHFASIAAWQHVRRSVPGVEALALSVMAPIGSLIDALNAYQPAYLASYPTMLAVLAGEQRRGRLRIAPSLIWSGGETLDLAANRAIERTFRCRVMNEYGASECLSIAFGCPEGWLHVNDDWVIVEPVDRSYRRTPPGELSDTVLVTNLANLVQPIIRYDLGDAVTMQAGRCHCGNPFPAIRVQGRQDDVIVLEHGAVRIPPMALTTLVERSTEGRRFQIVQRGDALRVRLACNPAHRKRLFDAVARVVRQYLAVQGVQAVQVLLDDAPPRYEARSGKLRQVIVEARAP
jgi:phenylacetate-coenzyme A ligase PaaK-like adenylate-forming protein